MKDEKRMWPPLMVKYFGPALTRKGALAFLVLGFGTSILCVWIADWIKSL